MQFVITGYSHKRDGFCWTTEAADQDEALKKLVAAIVAENGFASGVVCW